MSSEYSSDSDSEKVVFVTEDGSAFSMDELENLLTSKINPHTGSPLTDNDITSLHQMLLEPESEVEEIEFVDYQPFFKFPYLTLYTMLSIQLAYIVWSVV